MSPGRRPGGTSPLDRLVAIDRLEVGPPRIEARSVTVPYTVVTGSSSDTLEFAYKYEEDLFDPSEPGAVNLASVMGAQVALNYGLFCREIRLRGAFDARDRRFLEEMAENTSREIYVKKILEPNLFLQGDAAKIPAERHEIYTRARIEFEGPADPATADWPSDRRRHAVLSSGGKDSLLTFGLLREMGREAHPVYVNESGRHWYTALNSYRSMKTTWPRTARVWTNSDRVFSWMLRHLPFVRQDFARVRSDEYAIRLWTVAVFLFGAMPVLRRRAIGRLLIGDEYDTSRRLRHEGIPHYDGLFDQSRWFDETLTRYFGSKGWSVSQFSVLRPFSELLIQKILALRYPDLLRDQVSCHAAHLEGERVLPCGRCEKCRRIVGMLTAVDADPTACGYTPEQIAACLESIGTRPVHQEVEGSRHLLWTLVRKGKVTMPASARKPRPHPEVLKIRIDRERSPLDGMPVDLRAPLLKIAGEHADGAVRRVGRVWVPFDPLSHPSLSSPYPFEKASAARRDDPPAGASPGGDSARKEYLLAEMTWREAQRRFKETDLALLPVGAIEQHGPHLPLDVDAWDAEYTCREVATACRAPRPIVLPLIPYGVSYHHDDFAGTISISPETLSRLVYEVGMSAARHGITKLVIVNGHGGNVPTLQFAAQSINRDARIFTCVETGDTSDSDIAKITETPNDVHAGETETSTTLATRPELVQMDKAERFVPRFSSQYLDFTSARSVEWYARTSRISRSGVLGDPTLASREKGERIWRIMIDHLVTFVETLKVMSLDEIYEKRY
jgi:creatinine amidohydrolase/Fe(II)-dependent formamide hydrolase-like protein